MLGSFLGDEACTCIFRAGIIVLIRMVDTTGSQGDSFFLGCVQMIILTYGNLRMRMG